MRVDAGGYINVTDKNNIYVISQRDFEDTYEIEQDNLLAEVIFDMEEMSVRFLRHIWSLEIIILKYLTARLLITEMTGIM